MPLKLMKQQSTEGKWFRFTGDVEFKIRPLLATTVRDIEASAQTGRQITDPRSKRQVPEIDEKKREDLLTDYLLEDWKNVLDEDDKPVPVSLENKKALMNLLAVSDFIWESARSLDILLDLAKN